MSRSFDLNADIGEGMSGDAALLGVVSSASIACGGHAGNAETIRAAIVGAMKRGVALGAHPGFADTENFGRLRLDLPVDEICGQVRAQLELFDQVAGETGAKAAYVKLHGALANMAAEDVGLATAIFSEVRLHDDGLAVLALAGSAQVAGAERAGLAVVGEAYADRAYLADGMLAPRAVRGAVLHDISQFVAQVLRLAENGEIIAMDGTSIRCAARSICVHGDNPDAVAAARAIRKALEAAGFPVKAPEAFLRD